MLAASSRFSLLLLEEGEYYFEDFSVEFYPNKNDFRARSSKLKGRLKLCSKSLILDPEDTSYPVMRLPFAKIESMEPLHSGAAKDYPVSPDDDAVSIMTEMTVFMLAGGTVAPYEFDKTRTRVVMALNYVSVADFLRKASALHEISQLPLNQTENYLAAIMNDRESTVTFDPSWIEDISESQLLEVTGARVSPLVNNPGRILITNLRLYFQAFNNIDAKAVEKYERDAIEFVEPRRYLLRGTGLELFFKDGSSVFFSFKTPKARDDALTLLVQTAPGSVAASLGGGGDGMNMTLRWQNRLVSNFDYLMWLNKEADRTFNDLTQYPVFPWVVADYTSPVLDLSDPATFRDLSKPIGALNAERLEMFLARFAEMPDDPDAPPRFLYGTHYSTPGYVLYYRVREAPELMLKLQTGRFDSPDRLFSSVAETWESVLTNPGDVKELIPEFYSGDGSLFVNQSHLDLGTRQNGKRVHNVELPPWAEGPQDFVNKLAAALESDYVSDHLHEWIDLIFGYKQKGEAAVAAHNLFYYLTYEGAVNIDAIDDPLERSAMETQIKEFGQTPRQIFTAPHPKRRSAEDSLSAAAVAAVSAQDSSTSGAGGRVRQQWGGSGAASSGGAGAGGSGFGGGSGSSASLGADFGAAAGSPSGGAGAEEPLVLRAVIAWERPSVVTCSNVIKLHKDEVTGVRLSKDNQTVYSVSKDSTLRVYSLSEGRQLRNVTIGSLALSSCALSEDEQSVYVGSWDNNVYVYAVTVGRVCATVQAHDDAVSCLHAREGKVFTSSWDSTLKAFDVLKAGLDLDPLPTADYVDHEVEVSTFDVTRDSARIVSGSNAGRINVWNAADGYVENPIEAHDGEVKAIALSPNGSSFVSVGEDETLKMYDVSGAEVLSVDVGEVLNCVATDGLYVVGGGADGRLRFWELGSGSELTVDHAGSESGGKDSSAPIVSLAVSSDGATVVAGRADGYYSIYSIS